MGAMETIDYTRIAFGLGVLLILLAGFYWGMRKLSGSTRLGKWRPGQRIGLVDMAPVDGTRRLVLVRRDRVEHLLLLGDDGDLVVESGIPVEEPPPPAENAASRGWPSLRLSADRRQEDRRSSDRRQTAPGNETGANQGGEADA